MLNSTEELQEIEKAFNEKWNFPGCIKAINGKHVAVRVLMFSGNEYYNYKNVFDLILIAEVNAYYWFRYIVIGAQGQHSNSGVFDHCSLKHMIAYSKMHIPENFVFVGDEAFLL